ncbi:hypothetical protein Javan226_0007 [Streptococcus phage Javan226]|uniref:Uncharacterized protein n=1 Tax=Streptococcus gallolyticus TaxID=315405 RepID=A0A139R3P8_9STRE|nr:hypothetical protein [Streptococcus gallolyticus]KXU09388.1 hypothetical protein SGADD03_00793 [Streptococcus gallolyticus]QBX25026.1 hypothetical protein Javan226_0007 [Streptococcus phage Javan226]
MLFITNENVQIVTLYATVVIALVGFVFNVISLWQTKKATEDMAKPYVNVYVDAYAVKSQVRVYVFKNFGQTPAYIEKISVKGDIDAANKYHFQSLVGNMLAPNQKITSSIQPDFKGECEISITYKDMHNNIYNHSYTLNTQVFEDFVYTINESNKSNEIPTAIRQSTMALLRDLRS